MGLRVAELFAGVGGFRLGLETAGHRVVWSNQWEPSTKAQHASECYVRHFGPAGHTNVDIATVDAKTIPDHDLLVGGFPCQDYSVATTKAKGIEGKKGVLWWEIERILSAKRPKYVLLENVDRLLKSPTSQRGRDFAVVLRCLSDLGYSTEWRLINAADYGFPQRRRRVFIFAALRISPWGRLMQSSGSRPSYLDQVGFFSQSFPTLRNQTTLGDIAAPFAVLPEVQVVSDEFSKPFLKAGMNVGTKVWCRDVLPKVSKPTPLRDLLQFPAPPDYYIPREKLARWEYLKGAKAERRVAANGFEYHYTEGAIPFPDEIDAPARTLMTGEGGTSPSRFNHIIRDPTSRRLRVLTPIEAERINGFPDDWTEGMPEHWRYFCMGNALVVGLITRMGRVLSKEATVRQPTLAKIA